MRFQFCIPRLRKWLPATVQERTISFPSVRLTTDHQASKMCGSKGEILIVTGNFSSHREIMTVPDQHSDSVILAHLTHIPK